MSHHNDTQHDTTPIRSGKPFPHPHQHKCPLCTKLTKDGNFTQNPTKNQPNPLNSKPKHTVAQHMSHDNHTETTKIPPDNQPEDSHLHSRTICLPTNPSQPWRKFLRKPVKTTLKHGMTEGETREHSTFALTTNIQHTSQCVQHTHLSVQRITTRQQHTKHKINTHLSHLRATPSYLSHATLNVFVKDGRRLQTKLASKKDFSQN